MGGVWPVSWCNRKCLLQLRIQYDCHIGTVCCYHGNHWISMLRTLLVATKNSVTIRKGYCYLGVNFEASAFLAGRSGHNRQMNRADHSAVYRRVGLATSPTSGRSNAAGLVCRCLAKFAPSIAERMC